MSNKVVQTQAAYNRPEELTNIITHAVAAALSFVGLVLLMLKTTRLEYSALGICAVVVFGLAMITTFVISMLCHAMPYGGKAREILRRLDRCTVAILIFGVYAPVMLIGMVRGTNTDAVWGYALFAVIAATAVLSILFSCVDAAKLKAVRLVTYVVMGCACILRVHRIVALCGYNCFWFLLGGSVLYALGIIFYGNRKIPFNHAIWHLFVIAGAALNFTCVYAFMV